ncbi:MAG: LysM peptidoglycan-binding domain-containing protein [Alphaproteobacteria bacterium]
MANNPKNLQNLSAALQKLEAMRGRANELPRVIVKPIPAESKKQRKKWSSETTIMHTLVIVLAFAFIAAVWWSLAGDQGFIQRNAQQDSKNQQNAQQQIKPEIPGPAPSFDVVRVEPGGAAILAGRAAPGADVTVLLDGEAVGTAQADRRGEWLLLPDTDLTVGSHRLDLQSQLEGYRPRLSDDLIVIDVPKGRPANESQVFLLGKQPGAERRVLQGAAGGLVVGALRLESVDYDPLGNATIRGRAPAGGHVVARIDDKGIGEAYVAADGIWRLVPDSPVAEGDHQLEVELRNANGRVMWKLKAPFTRHGEQFIADHGGVQGEDAEGRPVGVGKVIVVEKGNSLWLIARRELGEGLLYSVIFERNRTQITNPDLIFPGQVFEVPLNPDLQ